MPEQQRVRAKGRKIGRNRKHQAAMYRAQDRASKNRKRRMRRHLRNHPADEMAAAIFAQDYGARALATGVGVSARADRREWKKAQAKRRAIRARMPDVILEALAARGVHI